MLNLVWFNALSSEKLSFKLQPICLRPITAIPSQNFGICIFCSIGLFSRSAIFFNAQSIFLILWCSSHITKIAFHLSYMTGSSSLSFFPFCTFSVYAGVLFVYFSFSVSYWWLSSNVCCQPMFCGANPMPIEISNLGCSEEGNPSVLKSSMVIQPGARLPCSQRLCAPLR